MKKILCGTLALIFSASISAQIKGRVFADTDQDGKAGKTEQGLAEVSVSDGLNVVKTDKNGNFEISTRPEARFIFVTTPSGYRNLSRHYIKVDKSTAEYNFPLVKREYDDSKGFSIIHIADTETGVLKQWTDNLRDWAETNPTAYIVHTGDICYQHGLNNHGRNVRSEHMGAETLYCVGNHDLVDGDYGEQLFEKNLGPAWYSFEAGNVHFIVTPMLGGDRKPSYTIDGVAAWMRNDLAATDPSKKTVMFNHDLWFQGTDLIIKSSKGDIDMARHNLEAFVYGHWHSHFVLPIAGAMTYCSSAPDKGGIDHGASCFRVLSFDGEGNVSSRTRYTYINGRSTIVSPTDRDTVYADKGMLPVTVNAYRTVSPTKSVKAAINNGEWKDLVQNTDWAWSSQLPVHKGQNRITVQTEFEDGTIITERSDFYVTPQKPTVTPDSNWNNLSGNAAHDITNSGNAEKSPRVVWTASAGSNIWMVAPIISGGRLFTATMDDDNLEKCFVIAYDAATGRELWRYKTDNSVKNTIVCNDSLVMACDASGVVYAINAENGCLAWRYKTGSGTLPSVYHGSAIDGSTLYAGQAAGVSAIDITTGLPLWTNTHWQGGEGTTSTMTVGEGVVLASGHWSGIYAHDIKTGNVLWEKKDGNSRFRDGSPVIKDGAIYFASGNMLMVIEPKTGDIRQSAECGVRFNAAAAPIVTDSMIYMATSDRGVAAFDRQTLKQKWNFTTMPPIFYSVPYNQDSEFSVENTPLLVGGTLIFGASDGYLYGVNAKDGTARWKRNIGVPIFSSPAISGNAVYVSDFAGNIICFEIK